MMISTRDSTTGDGSDGAATAAANAGETTATLGSPSFNIFGTIPNADPETLHWTTRNSHKNGFESAAGELSVSGLIVGFRGFW
jgi:hypothetical protein